MEKETEKEKEKELKETSNTKRNTKSEIKKYAKSQGIPKDISKDFDPKSSRKDVSKDFDLRSSTKDISKDFDPKSSIQQLKRSATINYTPQSSSDLKSTRKKLAISTWIEDGNVEESVPKPKESNKELVNCLFEAIERNNLDEAKRILERNTGDLNQNDVAQTHFDLNQTIFYFAKVNFCISFFS